MPETLREKTGKMIAGEKSATSAIVAPMNNADIQKKLRAFAKARKWEPFHSPKNLAAALSVEASELLEIFQWLTEEQSHRITADKKEMAHVKEEMADVLLYLLRLADVLGVDLEKAAQEKMKKNAQKYPVTAAKGNAVKYTKRRQ